MSVGAVYDSRNYSFGSLADVRKQADAIKKRAGAEREARMAEQDKTGLIRNLVLEDNRVNLQGGAMMGGFINLPDVIPGSPVPITLVCGVVGQLIMNTPRHGCGMYRKIVQILIQPVRQIIIVQTGPQNIFVDGKR